MIGKVKRYISNKVRPQAPLEDRFYKGESQEDLIIFDNFLPNTIGSWRAIEMAGLLEAFPKSKLYFLLRYYEEHEQARFAEDQQQFVKEFGVDASKLYSRYNEEQININAKLAYCLFINNLKLVLPTLEKHSVPFVFTIFPGGGFNFYDKEVDGFLTTINKHPLFRRVIVTQQSIYDYLVDRKLIDKEKIVLHYGAMFNISEYELAGKKRYYLKDKETLDICFVAAKNVDHGLDKGFDVFIQACYKLTQEYDMVRAHVVGGFDKSSLLYDIPEDKIHFYGYQKFDWFKSFYVDKDIIVSPVKPYVLEKGAFDGFPTGGCVDAGLLDTVIISSDPTGDNILPQYKDGEELIIAGSNPYEIVEAVKALIDEPASIPAIAGKGKQKLKQLFDHKEQLGIRVNILKQAINTHIQ